MKKIVCSVMAATLACMPLIAQDQDDDTVKLTITPFGELGGLYNQGIASPGKHSYGNLMAHAGVDFALDNGWRFGLGAIGSWAIWDASSTSQSSSNVMSGNSGDISEAYVHYKNSRLEFAVGRFSSNFLEFDYMSGNIQGGAGVITTHDGKMRYWAMFADSMLYTGAHRNTSSTLYGTNVIYSYYPYSKRNIMGIWGEVLAGGLSYFTNGMDISAFLLLDTQLPANRLPGRNGILFQAGGKLSYETDFSGAWHSKSVLRGIFQLGNTSKQPAASIGAGDGLAGLVWLDQTFGYRMFEFGAGIYSVISSYGNGGIYTFSDPTRYYGKVINAPMAFPSPYFSSGSAGQFLNGYIFGSIDLMKSSLPFRLDGMISFGRYQEYSLMLDYNAWKYRDMKLNVGLGYVFSKVAPSSIPGISTAGLQSSLLIFGKFYY